VEGSPQAAEIVRQATEKSTFWRDAQAVVSNPTGEVFFELAEHSTYVLKSLVIA
jgi:hypothetical protein